MALRPTVNFTRPLGLIREPERDAILFVNIALEIHVGEGVNQLSFQGNKPEFDILFHQFLLDLAVGDLSSQGLDIFLNRFFDIIRISFTSRLLDLGPCIIRSSIGNVVTVDLASILAILSEVT